MANLVKLKRSAVPGRVPATGDLELGELALNTYDGKLYTKKDDGTPSVIQIGAGGGGGTGFLPVLTHFGITVDVDILAGFLSVLTHSGSTVEVPIS